MIFLYTFEKNNSELYILQSLASLENQLQFQGIRGMTGTAGGMRGMRNESG